MEICTRNRPLSETKFLGDFWGPLSLPAPFVLLLIASQIFRENRAKNLPRKSPREKGGNSPQRGLFGHGSLAEKSSC